MAKLVTCSACGEVAEIPSCSACGAELHAVALDRVPPALDQDQKWLERDQSASDQDQTWSDHDQTASDSDQRSADEDQHASDEDLSAGGDAVSHRRSAAARGRTSQDRAAVSELRGEGAASRVETAKERDRTASLRDRATEDGDALVHLDDRNEAAEIPEDILTRARQDRARAAADRAKAADDRERAAIDREQASRERAEALENRTESAQNLKRSTTDELTGVWTRMFGIEELARELERAHRTGSKLVIAFVDIDGLKAVNDRQGHLAGDALLKFVGKTILDNVRPYDVVLRYGGDEFVCGMPNLSARQAKARFERIAAMLAAVDAEHSITFGLAEAEPADSLQDLIARADAALLQARQ